MDRGGGDRGLREDILSWHSVKLVNEGRRMWCGCQERRGRVSHSMSATAGLSKLCDN